jgi:hypothetical protein
MSLSPFKFTCGNTKSWHAFVLRAFAWGMGLYANIARMFEVVNVQTIPCGVWGHKQCTLTPFVAKLWPRNLVNFLNLLPAGVVEPWEPAKWLWQIYLTINSI